MHVFTIVILLTDISIISIIMIRLDQVDNCGRGPLTLAAMCGHMEVIIIIILIIDNIIIILIIDIDMGSYEGDSRDTFHG